MPNWRISDMLLGDISLFLGKCKPRLYSKKHLKGILFSMWMVECASDRVPPENCPSCCGDGILLFHQYIYLLSSLPPKPQWETSIMGLGEYGFGLTGPPGSQIHDCKLEPMVFALFAQSFH